MFRTISRLLLPNPLDRLLKKTAKKGGRRILIAWNRGLGDIALGLYAIVHRVREKIPNAEITFLVRKNLLEGFSLLQGVRAIAALDWERGRPYSVKKTLASLGIDPKQFDLILEKPSPTDWVRWQRGTLTPRLQWNPLHDGFDLFSKEYTYIGVQPVAESQYGLWRNWPHERWTELFHRLERFKQIRILLFGYGSEPKFAHPNVIDLRGKTNLFELLSLIKNFCKAVILPDSGILSMTYYLDVDFPIQVVSLWADPNHGILKQAVSSPNRFLVHDPLIGAHRDLSSVSAQMVLDRIFPVKPLTLCPRVEEIHCIPQDRVGVVLLAGGEGSRLGAQGPKGTFLIQGKSLFQWICEKVPPSVPIAVMTSPSNHAETVAFFQAVGCFGRSVFFFQQEQIPVLDEKKRPLIISAPDGNGGVFKAFAASGMDALFEERGVDLVSIVPVDNPLADPMDASFFSFLRLKKADVAIKCIEEKEADAPMGALVERMGRLEVVEYMEIDSSMQYPYRYTGMMALEYSLMKRLASVELPLHWVWKKNGGRFVWKGERFLFDALPFSSRPKALCYPREQSYAALKSIENLYKIEETLKRKEFRSLV